MKQLKDTSIKYDIKLEIVRQHFKEDDCHSNIPYQIFVTIESKLQKVGSNFSYNQKGKKQALKFIKEECNLE